MTDIQAHSWTVFIRRK